MPKNKGIYRLFRTKAELRQHDDNIRDFERAFTLDLVTLALGRTGFRESRLREFDAKLTEVYREYMTEFSSDLKDDAEMVYSRAVMDRELKQYTGSMFRDFEHRYAPGLTTRKDGETR